MHSLAPGRHPVIFDSTVLSNFAVCGQISLLEQLFQGRAFTTLMVVDEIKKGVAAGYNYLEVIETILTPLNRNGWLVTLSLDIANEQERYMELQDTLDPGEASCLTLAMTRGLVLATDDLAARRIAQNHNVVLTGTVGILIRLVRDRLIPLGEANKILENMITRRYRSPVKRLDDLI